MGDRLSVTKLYGGRSRVTKLRVKDCVWDKVVCVSKKVVCDKAVR